MLWWLCLGGKFGWLQYTGASQIGQIKFIWGLVIKGLVQSVMVVISKPALQQGLQLPAIRMIPPVNALRGEHPVEYADDPIMANI
jgi:hypothetical protein